jgi:hypothetical protein
MKRVAAIHEQPLFDEVRNIPSSCTDLIPNIPESSCPLPEFPFILPFLYLSVFFVLF